MEDEEIPYKQLSKFEKLKEVQQHESRGDERLYAAVYLKALWLNNKEVLDHYESFGDSFRKIIMNKMCYDRQSIFGIQKMEFDEYGWLIRQPFQELLVIDLGFKNNIEVASANNYHVCGHHLSIGTAGSYSSACHWGIAYKSKNEAIKISLQHAIKWHESEQGKNSNKIITKAKEEIDNLIGAKQLYLF